MGIGVVVHGIIESPGWGTQEPSVRTHTHNQRVIEALPQSDTEWPYLTRSMFSILPLRQSFDVQIPQYEKAVIHFAGAYKGMFILESDWIRKFEKLLAQLCWTRAIVYNQFSSLVYEWEADWPSESFFHTPPIPPKKWKLTCGLQKIEPMRLTEAIDGPYTPLL